MIYAFGQFELDLATVELRAGGEAVDLEPQVFALLALLVENGERLVSKDEIIEKVWDGRGVTDAAVASRVKTARQALGDDGKSQQFIKTIHGHGYRFVAKARVLRAATAAQLPAIDTSSTGLALVDMVRCLDRMSRPSLAVLPFRYIAGDERYAALASALPDGLIADLARLRWLLVTARGSSFRLRAPEADFGDIGRLLGVRYCLSGTVEVSAERLVIVVDLVNTSDGAVVWADRFSGRIDDVHAMREQIRSQVLMAFEIRIPLHEASLARLAPVENLDAWSAYHLGMQHLYRFNRRDNSAAIDAQGIYARAWTEVLSGKAVDGRAHVDLAMRLSPLDPLHYAMLATRAFTQMASNEDAQAAHWAERGARSPGAHVLIALIAAAAHTLAGDAVRAAFWADNVRRRNDTLTREVFFRSFPMKSDSMSARLDRALLQMGFR